MHWIEEIAEVICSAISQGSKKDLLDAERERERERERGGGGNIGTMCVKGP